MQRPRNAFTPHGKAVIVGLDAIGQTFGRSRWSVARWIKWEGFPAARLQDGRWRCQTKLI